MIDKNKLMNKNEKKQMNMTYNIKTLEQKQTAIQGMVEIVLGMERNTHDNATGVSIQSNYYSISPF